MGRVTCPLVRVATLHATAALGLTGAGAHEVVGRDAAVSQELREARQLVVPLLQHTALTYRAQLYYNTTLTQLSTLTPGL